MPTLTLATRSLPLLATDALVVGLASGGGGQGVALACVEALPADATAHLLAAARTLGLKGVPDETARIPAVPGLAAASVVLTGLGADPGSDAYPAETLRRAAGAATRSVLGKAERVAVALPAPTPDAVGAVAEGALLGCYRYAERPASGGPSAVQVVSGAGKGAAVKAALQRASVLAAGVTLTRDLVNLPGNLLNPETFAARAKSVARASTGKLSVKVLDASALAKLGCGGILGVGQGSAVPPCIVVVRYAPAKPKSHLALVGKGITFDTGGYRIKPIDSMTTMKSDMAGAAAVLATVVATAELEVPVAVTGYLCLAENMISGSAQRPGDVVTMANGLTVEVIDPDAEGRMVLGDGLVLASREKPDAIVDIATLTGMVTTALGRRIAGLMGNDGDLAARVGDAATDAGESLWLLPLPQEYRASLDTMVADLMHKAGAEGGALIAGLFLQEFVGEGIPWAHLDIASTGFNSAAPRGYLPKGGTGFGVATLLRLVESYA